MLGSGSKFDTNNHNFFANNVPPQAAPLEAPKKSIGAKNPEVDTKQKEVNPFAKKSIFAVARSEGRSNVSDDQPPENYDGHKFGNKFFSPYS